MRAHQSRNGVRLCDGDLLRDVLYSYGFFLRCPIYT